MRLRRRLALVAGVAAIATAAFVTTSSSQTGQRVTGPIAVYWMSAQTQTGFGMPGAGGGAADPQAMMRAMMGGGGAQKSLQLDLGSSNTAPAPAADHLPPAALQAGPSLPLLTPKAAPPAPETDTPPVPRDFQRPRGRMLIFWGCGERAKPGQPVVIDFAQMSTNPQAMAGLMRGLDVRAMRPPAPGRNKTYGGWPNERTRAQVSGASSLVGEHTVRGNYSPEIRFTLEADQDFLGALNLTTNAKAPAGHANLGWNLVPNAQAYYATVVGGGQDTVVMWTSSEQQSVAFAMPDFIAQGDIGRLVASKALMGPATRACAVPKEVLDAAPQGLVQLTAFGGEANFVYPPRPTDPKVAWNQQWAVKVRYRSATGGLLGQPMPSLAGDDEDAPPARPGRQGRQQPNTPAQPRTPSAADILRGTLGIPRF